MLRSLWVSLVLGLSVLAFTSANSLAKPEAAASDSEAKKLVARADSIAKEVAKLRGLKLKQSIARGVMSKAQIEARILKLVKTEYTPDELTNMELLAKRFGLIPESMDYLKTTIDLLKKQIAGFYDHREKKLYIAGWQQSGGDMVMAHEIDHALQDQHFDLGTFMKPAKDNSDASAARQALVEGDGMALMLEYQMAQAKQSPPWGNPLIMTMMRAGFSQVAGSMGKVPLSMSEGLAFPYLGGVEFIAHFRKHHSWKRIDEIYKRPPLSTEHILHPKKYESHEAPHEVQVTLPAALAKYLERQTDVFGEKGLEIFLRTHGVAQAKAEIAAAGWGGDRVAVYSTTKHKGSKTAGTVGVMLTSWDTEGDAEEFFEALETVLPVWSKQRVDLAREELGPGVVIRVPFAKKYELSVERRGEVVVLVIGASPNAGARVRGDVFDSWAVTKP